MSGGHFDYQEYRIEDMARSILRTIKVNNIKPDWINDEDWDGQMYSDEVIEEFKKGVEYLRMAYIYAHRIDYLIEGDDGEKEFLRRLKKDIENFKIEEYENFDESDD